VATVLVARTRSGPMFLAKTQAALHHFLQSYRNADKSIGFVPTMGALHAGHLSLIRQCQQENDYSVCSIFVNPTQFNEEADLASYPRTPAKDVDALLSVGCDLLFMPSPGVVYPPDVDLSLDLDLGNLARVMEGAFRPGHFQGVAQVVSRLLDLLQPHRLYLGQKDFQQYSIVQYMLQQQQRRVELRQGKTVREEDGLAMSSRNQRLLPEHRKQAPIIYRTLCWVKEQFGTQDPRQLEQQSLEKMSLPGFRPEYFQIVDARTLAPLAAGNEQLPAVACTAVWAGDVRLIDNIPLN